MSGRRKKDIFMLPKATFVSIKGRRHFIAADIANSVEGLAGYCKDPIPQCGSWRKRSHENLQFGHFEILGNCISYVATNIINLLT